MHSTLYAHLRRSTSVEDMMAVAPINELWEDITKNLQEEDAPSAKIKPKESDAIVPVSPLQGSAVEVLRAKVTVELDAKGLDDPDDKLPDWLQYAETLVNERVKLVLESAGDGGMTAALADTHVCKLNLCAPQIPPLSDRMNLSLKDSQIHLGWPKAKYP